MGAIDVSLGVPEILLILIFKIVMCETKQIKKGKLYEVGTDLLIPSIKELNTKSDSFTVIIFVVLHWTKL